MIHASPTTTKEFALNYDRHGDSYIEDTSIEQLKKVFQKVEKEVPFYVVLYGKFIPVCIFRAHILG